MVLGYGVFGEGLLEMFQRRYLGDVGWEVIPLYYCPWIVGEQMVVGAGGDTLVCKAMVLSGR